MGNVAIFHPVIVLVIWTLAVLVLVSFVRVRSIRRRQIGEDDFRVGESAAVPPGVSLPNRAYMNLLELPVLFYVACIVLFVTGGASYLTIAVAWVFVVFRIVHSVIHLTYNRVAHRTAAFGASLAALIVLWVFAAAHVLAAPPL
jgi:hypothetical protein